MVSDLIQVGQYHNQITAPFGPESAGEAGRHISAAERAQRRYRSSTVSRVQRGKEYF